MKEQLLEQFFNGSAVALSPINIIDSLLSLIFAGLFGWLIANSYRYSSQSISGGRQIISSLLPLTLTVCVIITVVKSSLALSLGLVGALSIVRFRTPVKDPEDLVYLFLSIVTGLGFGANQNLFTTFGVSCILVILTLRSFLFAKKYKRFKPIFEFNLNLEWEDSDEIKLESLIELISISCDRVSFVRFDKLKSNKNLILQVNLLPDISIDKLINDITGLGDNISVQIYNSAIEY